MNNNDTTDTATNKTKYVVAIEFGAANIRIAVLAHDENSKNLIYIKSYPNENYRKFKSFNTTQVKSIIKDLEDELEIRVKMLIVAHHRNCNKIISHTCEIKTNPDNAIDMDAINLLLDTATDEIIDNNSTLTTSEEIYHIEVQCYNIDEQQGLSIDEAIDNFGQVLSANLKCFIGQKNYFNSLSNTLKKNLNIDVYANPIFIPAAMGELLLDRHEKEEGVGIIDFGASHTSISIFHKGSLRYYYCLPFGSYNISYDLSKNFSISIEQAELIKKRYYTYNNYQVSLNNKRMLSINNDSGQSILIRVADLISVAEDRLNEIIDAILYKIEESGYKDYLNRGLILVGEAFRLKNILEYIKRKTNYTVKYAGIPKNNEFSPTKNDSFKDINIFANAGILSLLYLSKDIPTSCAEAINDKEYNRTNKAIPDRNKIDNNTSNKATTEENSSDNNMNGKQHIPNSQEDISKEQKDVSKTKKEPWYSPLKTMLRTGGDNDE